MQDPQHYERLSSDVGRLAAAPAADTDGDDEDSPFTPEIVPIAEGEVTAGAGSGKRTEWERNPLKAATEAGAFDNAKLVRGQAALNPHWEMDEQLSPDDIVGDAGTFHYEDGRGPVSNDDGVIVDDHIAKLVENGLVEISPDMFRSLGEWDDSLADGQGAHSVEQIVDVPRMTILDRGAGPNAELGPAETEALAALPEYDDLPDDEQLAPRQTPRTPEHEGTTSGEWNAPSLDEYISSFADEDDQDASEVSDLSAASKSAIASKTLLGRSNADTADDLISFPVVTTENNLHESALDAVLSRAPQAEYLSEEQADALQSKARSLLTEEFDRDLEEQNAMTPAPDGPEVEQLAQLQYLRFWPDPVPEGDEEPLDVFDAAADAVDAIEGVTAVLNTETDSDGTVRDAELLAVLHSDRADLGTLNDDLMSALDETRFEAGSGYDWVPELETEYLARRDETREHSNQPMGADSDPSESADIDPSTMGDDTTKEELREQLAAAEAQNEEYEDRIDDLEDENETLESEIESEREQRMEDTEHIRRRYAEAVTDSDLAAQALVDNDDKSVEDLAEMALEAEEGESENEASDGEEDEEQLSPMERYEQLAAENPEPRGGGGEDDPGSGNGQPTEEQLAEVEQLSRTVMSGDDVMTASEEQLSAREFVRQHKGVDPSEFDSETALRSAIERENGGEA